MCGEIGQCADGATMSLTIFAAIIKRAVGLRTMGVNA
jgi:hypothetical protein